MDKKMELIGDNKIVAQHAFGTIVEGTTVAKWGKDEDGKNKIVGKDETMRFVSDLLICTAVGKKRTNAIGASVALSFQKVDNMGPNKPGVTIWVNGDYIALLEAVDIDTMCYVTGKFTPKGIRPSGEFALESISLRKVYPQS